MSRRPNVRKGTIQTQIDDLNERIKEFEKEVMVMHDDLDPESDSDLREIMKTQEQLDAYYEMKTVLVGILNKGE